MRARRAVQRWSSPGASLFVAAVAAVVFASGHAAIGVEPARASEPVVPYQLGGSTIFGARPTALGLPVVPASGTFGAAPAEFLPRLREYHDSGQYERDIAAVARAAREYIAARMAEAARPVRVERVCATEFRRATRTYYTRVRTATRGGARGRTVYRRAREPLYRRVRTCHQRRIEPRRFEGKPALVLDIDETSLSNYRYLAASGFSQLGVAQGAVLGGDAIAPTLELFNFAKRLGMAVFFITGTPPQLRQVREGNLRRVGYRAWDGVFYKPTDAPTARFKAEARATLEQNGYDVIANVGDQESDLAGGHADRAFKYPNPFYFIPN